MNEQGWKHQLRRQPSRELKFHILKVFFTSGISFLCLQTVTTFFFPFVQVKVVYFMVIGFLLDFVCGKIFEFMHVDFPLVLTKQGSNYMLAKERFMVCWMYTFYDSLICPEWMKKEPIRFFSPCLEYYFIRRTCRLFSRIEHKTVVKAKIFWWN